MSKSATVVKLAPRHREEIEFLPAALEIVETPPSPTGRITLYSIAALFALVLGWAALGKVDIVAVAPGRIVPSGHSKVIQPLETAVVTAIHVRDGQRVKAGDRLIDLDPTASAAESRKQRGDLQAVNLDIARLRAILAGPEQAAQSFAPPADSSAGLVEVHRRQLESQVAAHVAKVTGIERQVDQRTAERATIEATIAKLEASIPLIRARFDIRDEMTRRQLGSKIVQLENKQALVESENELLVQKSHLKTAEAALRVLAEQRLEARAEFARVASADLAEAERKAASLREEVIKAEQRSRLLAITAPIDGTVQQLAVHTVGGVVTSAQALLMLVPREAPVEIEAAISNRDIGFVREGQQAEIKIEAFDFTRYGLVHGKLETISRDAVSGGSAERDKADDRSRGGPRNTTSDGRGSELSFTTRVSLDRAVLDVDGARVALTPGMAVTVEVRTGSRSILSYLLSPVARYRQDAFRER